MIPFVGLEKQYRRLRPGLRAALESVIRSGNYVGGREISAFEESFARYCGRKYCVGLGSGTDAISAALYALGIGRGDEVILPALTFVSTAFAVQSLGAVPVLVDVDPVSLTLDPKLLPGALTGKTKAVMPVHLYGVPAPMDEIRRFTDKHKLFLVEDAAQAHGSVYDGKRAGALGSVIGCFSFYPSKNLGALGQAGAIVTDSERIAQKVHAYGNVGQSEKYIHSSYGINSRLDTLQAAALSVKLPHLDGWNRSRRNHAALYTQLLSGLPIRLPADIPKRIGNYHLYVIRTANRRKLREHLTSSGIGTGIHYPLPLHLQPALNGLGYRRGSFPVSELAARQVLSLPMYPELTDGQIHTVAASVRSFFTP